MSLRRKNRFLHGFSLIETSVSLLIVGIISGIIVTQMRIYQGAAASARTQSNIDAIVSSLAAYCIGGSDCMLPYPSSDREQTIGLSDQNMKNKFGIIPFKTLGIMEKFAKDGRGRWILYRMNPYFNEMFYPPEFKKLGVAEFSSSSEDKIAFIIKTNDDNGKSGHMIWYSENNFKVKFDMMGRDNFDRGGSGIGLN